MTDTRINGQSTTDPADIILPEFGSAFYIYKAVVPTPVSGDGNFSSNAFTPTQLGQLEEQLRRTFKSFFSTYPHLELFKGLRFHFYLHDFSLNTNLPTDSAPNNQLKPTLLDGAAGGLREKYHPFASVNRTSKNYFDVYGRTYEGSQDIGIAFYNNLTDTNYLNYTIIRQILAKMVSSFRLFDLTAPELPKAISRLVNEMRIALVRGHTTYSTPFPLSYSNPNFTQLFNELFYYNTKSGDPSWVANDPLVPSPSYGPAVEWHMQMRSSTERSWFGPRRFCEDVIYFLGGRETIPSAVLKNRANPRLPADSDGTILLNAGLTGTNHIRRYQMLLVTIPIIYQLLQHKVFMDLSGDFSNGKDQFSIAPTVNTTYINYSELVDTLPTLLNNFPVSGKQDWVGWSFEDNNSYSQSATGGKRYQILTFDNVISTGTEIYHDSNSLSLYEYKSVNSTKKWVKVASFLPENMFISTSDSQFTGFQP